MNEKKYEEQRGNQRIRVWELPQTLMTKQDFLCLNLNMNEARLYLRLYINFLHEGGFET